MERHTQRNISIALALGLLFSLGAALAAERRAVAQSVCAETLRLHVLANSDTWEDQLLKLKVRDALLAAMPQTLGQAADRAAAEQALRQALPALQRTAWRAVRQAHSSQTVAVKLERCHFDAKEYPGFALPAGEYTALRVELGKAEGRNWFCVLYPALCVGGAVQQYPNAAQNALVFGKYELRSALWDCIAAVGHCGTPENAV